MIRAMHRRLALLLIGVIVLILCMAGAAAVFVSEQRMGEREWSEFGRQLDGLVQQLRLRNSIADADLARLEAEQRMVVAILDHGAPLAFGGAWQTLTPRETLFAAVTESARAAGVRFETDDMIDGMRYSGQIRGEKGERYLTAAVSMRDYRNTHAIVLLQDMRAADAQRARLRGSFACIAVAALVVLSAFGWFFSGWMLRPLAAAYRKQNEFIAAASHEIRTPLSVMQTGIDALKAHPPDAERFIAQIETEADRIAALTADLLLLTALRFSPRDILTDPIEPRELIREAQAAHSQAALAKGVELRVSLPGESLPLLAGDALRLERALYALIDNAIEYTPGGGTVELCAARQGSSVVLSVRDDGPGIPPEHRDRMFERFYRGARQEGGRTHTGLGLCIAREIVETHGGKLEYHAVSPHGSLFSMRLPGMRNM